MSLRILGRQIVSPLLILIFGRANDKPGLVLVGHIVTSFSICLDILKVKIVISIGPSDFKKNIFCFIYDPTPSR